MHPDTISKIRLPPHSVRLMCAMLIERGAPIDQVLESAGLSPLLLTEPDMVVDGNQEVAMQREFCRRTSGQAQIWFELGLRYRLYSHAHSTYSLFQLTSSSVQSAIEDSLDLLDANYSLMIGEGIYDGDRLAGLRLNPKNIPQDIREFCAVRDIAAACRVLNDMWRGAFPLARVTLNLSAETVRIVERALDGIAVVRGPEHTLLWSADLRDRTMPRADNHLHRSYAAELRMLIPEERIARTIQDEIKSIMNRAVCPPSLQELASELDMSTRTLQRRLREDNISFRKLMSEWRCVYAERLLRTSQKSIDAIAMEAGYQRSSSLDHAFRRYCGVSPNAYRDKLLSRTTRETT